MRLTLESDDGAYLAAWKVTDEAKLTPEFLQPLIDAITRHRRIAALKASDEPNAAWEAIQAEFDAVDELLDNWDN
jgi:hypothetical protein